MGANILQDNASTEKKRDELLNTAKKALKTKELYVFEMAVGSTYQKSKTIVEAGNRYANINPEAYGSKETIHSVTDSILQANDIIELLKNAVERKEILFVVAAMTCYKPSSTSDTLPVSVDIDLLTQMTDLAITTVKRVNQNNTQSSDAAKSVFDLMERITNTALFKAKEDAQYNSLLQKIANALPENSDSKKQINSYFKTQQENADKRAKIKKEEAIKEIKNTISEFVQNGNFEGLDKLVEDLKKKDNYIAFRKDIDNISTTYSSDTFKNAITQLSKLEQEILPHKYSSIESVKKVAQESLTSVQAKKTTVLKNSESENSTDFVELKDASEKKINEAYEILATQLVATDLKYCKKLEERQSLINSKIDELKSESVRLFYPEDNTKALDAIEATLNRLKTSYTIRKSNGNEYTGISFFRNSERSSATKKLESTDALIAHVQALKANLESNGADKIKAFTPTLAAQDGRLGKIFKEIQAMEKELKIAESVKSSTANKKL